MKRFVVVRAAAVAVLALLVSPTIVWQVCPHYSSSASTRLTGLRQFPPFRAPTLRRHCHVEITCYHSTVLKRRNASSTLKNNSLLLIVDTTVEPTAAAYLTVTPRRTNREGSTHVGHTVRYIIVLNGLSLGLVVVVVFRCRVFSFTRVSSSCARCCTLLAYAGCVEVPSLAAGDAAGFCGAGSEYAKETVDLVEVAETSHALIQVGGVACVVYFAVVAAAIVVFICLFAATAADRFAWYNMRVIVRSLAIKTPFFITWYK